jgi:high-affinity nickel permease
MGETPVRLPPRRVGLTVGGEACHRDASGRLEDIHNIDGVVGTSISALFPLVISIANLFFLNRCGSPDRYRRSEDTLHGNRDCGHQQVVRAGRNARNARTHTLHDQVRWKYAILGKYFLNGESHSSSLELRFSICKAP